MPLKPSFSSSKVSLPSKLVSSKSNPLVKELTMDLVLSTNSSSYADTKLSPFKSTEDINDLISVSVAFPLKPFCSSSKVSLPSKFLSSKLNPSKVVLTNSELFSLKPLILKINLPVLNAIASKAAWIFR